MNHAEKARDLFREGYNCAQSVVGAFHEEMGLSLSEAMRLASSFGGGMGGLRETCGAVTGMFLVAGMLMGYDDPADYDGKKAHYARIRQLAEQFRQKHDTLVCRELLRSLPEKLQKQVFDFFVAFELAQVRRKTLSVKAQFFRRRGCSLYFFCPRFPPCDVNCLLVR